MRQPQPIATTTSLHGACGRRRRRHRRARLPLQTVLALGCVLMLTPAALAQDLGNEVFARDGTVSAAQAGRTWDNRKMYGAESVTERDRSDYKPLGLRIGNFYFYPEAGVKVTADDNIYNTTKDPRSDLVTETSAGLKLVSNHSRHYFDFAFGGRFTKHATYDDLDRLDGKAAATAAFRIDSGHTLGAAVSTTYGHLSNIDPSVPTGIAEPIPFWRNHVALSLKRDAGRAWASLSTTATSTTHYDVRSLDGRRLDMSLRDLDVLSTSLQAGYRFSPGYELRAKVRGLRQETPGSRPDDFDGWGYEGAIGLTAEINPLLRWKVMGGYGARTFDHFWQPTYRSIGNAELTWLATQLTTVTLSAGRAFNEGASATASSGYIDNTLGVRVDHEIWRNLVFTLAAQYHAIEHQGIGRNDELYVARGVFDYLASRNVSFQLGYEHVTRHSNVQQENLTNNRVWFGAKLRF